MRKRRFIPENKDGVLRFLSHVLPDCGSAAIGPGDPGEPVHLGRAR